MMRRNSYEDKNKMENTDHSQQHVQPSIRQRRISIAPEITLPSITESSNGSVSSQASKSPDETSTRLQEYVKSPRRASVVSNSSVSSDTASVKSLSRRASFKKQPSNPQFDTSIARRDSVFNIMPSGRRASFKTLGKRVTTLLKAKNAFNKLKSEPKAEDVFDERKASEIKELPKEPRFASTLSAEAQYAMMKGYEDVVYGCLCTSYPEYRQKLRRNRTPAGVDVCFIDDYKNVTNHFGEKDDVDHADDEVDGTIKNETKSPRSLVPPLLPYGHTRPTLHEERTDISIIMEANSPPTMLQHVVSYNTYDNGASSRETSQSQTSSNGNKNLPRLVPKDKQLVMTYRYQSAMDILDNIRKPLGLHSLSPRVKETPTKPEHVRDFNSWSHVWNKEFIPKEGKTKT